MAKKQMTKEEFIRKSIKLFEDYIDSKAKYYEKCEDDGIDPVNPLMISYDEGKNLINEIADNCTFDDSWRESVKQQLSLLEERAKRTERLYSSYSKIYENNKELNDFWNYARSLGSVGRTAEMHKLAYTNHLNVYVRRNGVFLQSVWKGAFGLNVNRADYQCAQDDLSWWARLFYSKKIKFIREVAEELHREYFKRLDAITPLIAQLEKEYIGFTFVQKGKKHTYTAGTLFAKGVANFYLYGFKEEADTLSVIHQIVESIIKAGS